MQRRSRVRQLRIFHAQQPAEVGHGLATTPSVSDDRVSDAQPFSRRRDLPPTGS